MVLTSCRCRTKRGRLRQSIYQQEDFQQHYCKKVERQLGEEEQQLRMVVDPTPNGMNSSFEEYNSHFEPPRVNPPDDERVR